MTRAALRRRPLRNGDEETMTADFFRQPILNSPYAYPARHWELDEVGRPTRRICNGLWSERVGARREVYHLRRRPGMKFGRFRLTASGRLVGALRLRWCNRLP